MAASDDGPNFTDFIVTSISPVLIVGLVGSLVFFLVEILYGGKYEGRLLWTLFFFVIGIVLVARVAIQVDAGRAMAYGLALAVVCWLALMAFIEYPRDSSMAPFAPIINLVLMGVVWWCANKLTWDCTFIDENRISASKGLLVASGMEPRSDSSDKTLPEPKRGKARGGFWERYQRYRDRRAKQPHTPGVTVVYFSLAALPIFGLGQSLIPSDDASRRSFAFTLAACYVGCGLGLLLTTSFLGLRRYLRQRGVKMPVVMTGTWLGMGSVLIAGFLLVAALLPRPYSETPIWNLDRIGSPDRKASKNALFRDGTPGKGDGRGGNQSNPGKGQATAKNGEPGGKGDGDGKKGSGDRENGKSGGKSENGKSGDDNKGEPGDKKSGEDKDSERGSGSKTEDGKQADSKSGSERGDRRFPETRLGGMLEKVVGFLKWVVFILLGLAVLFILFRWGLQYFANFTDWAKNWLAILNGWFAFLFGRRKEGTQREDEVVARVIPKRPFHSFTNPFADGSAAGRPIEELIQYSFAALEAWANDRNHPCLPSETALEFASRLSSMFASLGNDAHRLAVLVARLAYAQDTISRDTLPILEQFWDRVTALMPEPAVA